MISPVLPSIVVLHVLPSACSTTCLNVIHILRQFYKFSKQFLDISGLVCFWVAYKILKLLEKVMF